MNEIYCDHPGQTKEEEDLPPPGHRRGKKKMVVKSKTAAKQANFKTVCSYFRDQLNNLINMLTTEPANNDFDTVTTLTNTTVLENQLKCYFEMYEA